MAGGYCLSGFSRPARWSSQRSQVNSEGSLMVHRQIHSYIKKWTMTAAFVAMMTANATAFFVIDAHYDEANEWQAQYCQSLQSGRHELRILVGKLSESTEYDAVRIEMQEFLAAYPEIDC